jgi:hypothetical protein
MSGESDEHAVLVSRLTAFVRERHGAAGNLALFLDDQKVGRERPQRIGGHLPDLYAQDVPRTFLVIGEAKTQSDLITPRSRRQLASFVRYLALHEAAFFYLAVPFVARPTATKLMRELEAAYGTVGSHILTIDTSH